MLFSQNLRQILDLDLIEPASLCYPTSLPTDLDIWFDSGPIFETGFCFNVISSNLVYVTVLRIIFCAGKINKIQHESIEDCKSENLYKCLVMC